LVVTMVVVVKHFVYRRASEVILYRF
jgi:hypothetical protein